MPKNQVSIILIGKFSLQARARQSGDFTLDFFTFNLPLEMDGLNFNILTQISRAHWWRTRQGIVPEAARRRRSKRQGRNLAALVVHLHRQLPLRLLRSQAQGSQTSGICAHWRSKQLLLSVRPRLHVKSDCTQERHLYKTSTLTSFVKPCNELNLAIQNVFSILLYMESAFTYNRGSTLLRMNLSSQLLVVKSHLNDKTAMFSRQSSQLHIQEKFFSDEMVQPNTQTSRFCHPVNEPLQRKRSKQGHLFSAENMMIRYLPTTSLIKMSTQKANMENKFVDQRVNLSRFQLNLLAETSGLPESFRILTLFDKKFQLLWKPQNLRFEEYETILAGQKFKSHSIVVRWNDAPISHFFSQ